MRRQYADGFDFFVTAAGSAASDDDGLLVCPPPGALNGVALLGPVADRLEARLLLAQGGMTTPALLEGAPRRLADLGCLRGSADRGAAGDVSEPDEAREQLQSALTAYRQLGAAPYAAQVEGALARLPGNVSLAGG